MDMQSINVCFVVNINSDFSIPELILLASLFKKMLEVFKRHLVK